MVFVLSQGVIENSAKARYLAGDSQALVDLLKSGEPLSEEFRNFVAEIIEGKIKKKRGAKPADFSLRCLHPLYLQEVEFIESLLKATGSLDPRGEALESVAKQHDLTPERLDKIIYPRKPKKTKHKIAK